VRTQDERADGKEGGEPRGGGRILRQEGLLRIRQQPAALILIISLGSHGWSLALLPSRGTAGGSVAARHCIYSEKRTTVGCGLGKMKFATSQGSSRHGQVFLASILGQLSGDTPR